MQISSIDSPQRFALLRAPAEPVLSTRALTLLLAVSAACGGDPPTPDAPAPDIGFNKPLAPLKANVKNAEVGPADLSCLGMPSGDPSTTVPIALSATVRDYFQKDMLMVGAVVTAFHDTEVGQPFDTRTADAQGAVTLGVPVGTRRFGLKMTHKDALDTLLLNQAIDPIMAAQSLGYVETISAGTAAALSAFIGKLRTAGTGVLAGAMRDCQGRDLSNFIATVSSAPGTAAHLAGADAYYFDPATDFPARHKQFEAASSDGLFMVIELAPTPTAYVQVWGYPADADLAADRLTLVGELQAPVIADTVITGTYEPLRTR